MADDAVLRRNLIELLEGGRAHLSSEEGLKGLRPERRGRRPARDVPSVFERLEHMRIAQEDILRYTLDAHRESPPWPEGYWPPEGVEPSEERWTRSLAAFLGDLEDVKKLTLDDSVDLTAATPHGEGRTCLRQILPVADHNAFHTGKIVQVRKLLGDWGG